MKISINIDLTSEEKKQLAAILQCQDDTKLEKALTAFGTAALREYVDMFLGQRVFLRGTDIREYRLLLLIRYGFQNVVPDEQRISDLFQTTPAQSKSLINSVLAKYQYELKAAIDDVMVQAIKNAKYDKESDFFEITNVSSSTVDRLNRILARINGNLTRVVKKAGTVSTFRVKPSSYDELRKYFNVS